jgi:hypothetical protein
MIVGPMLTLIALRRGSHWPPRRMDRVPRIATGNDRDAGLRRGQKRSQPEAEKPGHAHKGTLRKRNDAFAGLAATIMTSAFSSPAFGSRRCTNSVPMRRRNGPATACPASSPLA